MQGLKVIGVILSCCVQKKRIHSNISVYSFKQEALEWTWLQELESTKRGCLDSLAWLTGHRVNEVVCTTFFKLASNLFEALLD